jgi:hypothetical protein
MEEHHIGWGGLCLNWQTHYLSTVARLLMFLREGKMLSRFIHEPPRRKCTRFSYFLIVLFCYCMDICLQNSEGFSSAVLSSWWFWNFLRTFADLFANIVAVSFTIHGDGWYQWGCGVTSCVRVLLPFCALSEETKVQVYTYFRCGCFWHLQYQFVKAESRILGRNDSEITSRAGYAEGLSGGKMERFVIIIPLTFPIMHDPNKCPRIKFSVVLYRILQLV